MKRNASMPTAVIAQPIMMASGRAPAAIFCGRLKTPDPTMEPMSSAVSAPRCSLVCFVAEAAVLEAE